MAKKEISRYRSSFETDRKIIFTLALEKEFPQYDLDKRIDKDYRTVLRRIQFLEKNGLIVVARTEKSKKCGINKKILTLTELGLLYALANPQFFDKPTEEGIWPNIDKVASNYKEIWPLVFGEWDFICKNNLRDAILIRLQYAVYYFVNRLGREWYKITKLDDPNLKAKKLKLEKMTGKEKAEDFYVRHRGIVETLTNRVLGVDFFMVDIAPDEQTNFIKSLSKNPRFQSYLDIEFQYWVKKAKLDYDQAIDNLKWYQRIKEEKT